MKMVLAQQVTILGLTFLLMACSSTVEHGRSPAKVSAEEIHQQVLSRFDRH
jgi:hypothetical protein